jgi:hypothetical protein
MLSRPVLPWLLLLGLLLSEKRYSIEHRAGKAACLASLRKMTQPGEFCW